MPDDKKLLPFSSILVKRYYEDDPTLVPLLLSSFYGINPWDFKDSRNFRFSDASTLTRNAMGKDTVWYTDGVYTYPARKGSEFYNSILKASDIFTPVDPKVIRSQANLDYIGGTPHEARTKFWNKNPELVKFINETAVRYNISPNLLLHRLSKEGFVDHHLKQYNNYSTSAEQKQYKVDLNDEFYDKDGYNLMGMDNVGSFLQQNLLDLKDDVNYSMGNTQNEKYTNVTYATGKTLRDNIILQAATLEYIQKLMRKRGYPESQLDMYTNAAYNLGPYHDDLKNANYIQKNYSIPMYNINTYRSGGGISKKQLIAKNATKFAKGGVTENSEKPKMSWMSRADFLKAKANEEREFAHNYSLNRTESDVPLMTNPITEEEFKKRQSLKIAQLEKDLAEAPIERRNTAQYNLNYERNRVYDPYVIGWDCAYTSTGNYSQRGINRRCSGNLTFASNPQKYGFVPITKDQLRPGDLVQTPDKGHMMTFDSYSENGTPLYNYSNGTTRLRFQKSYPMDEDGYYYTFVGTPEDQRRWTGEWLKQYMPVETSPLGIPSNKDNQILPITITPINIENGK